jgi:hypothetical protein
MEQVIHWRQAGMHPYSSAPLHMHAAVVEARSQRHQHIMMTTASSHAW